MSKLPPALAKKKKNRDGAKKNSNKSVPFLRFFNRVSEKTVIDFTRNMAVMIKARVPLVQALDSSVNQNNEDRFNDVLKKVGEDVSSGTSFAKSLSAHPDIFDDLYIHMITVGETAGILDEVLFRLAEYREKKYALKKKIAMAMIYPALVLAVALIAVLFMLLFIVPTFADMYNDFNAELPQLTQMVLTVSNILRDYFLILGGGVLAVLLGVRWYVQTRSGRYLLDRAKLKIPFYGEFYKKTLITRFCQTLGTLLKSGIGMLEALKILKDSSGNLILQEAIEELQISVKRGTSLRESLRAFPIFPNMVVQMVMVGEETSELDEMLLHIAEYYTEEVDTMVEGLTSIIEPVLIIILGILLGAIIVAMYLPIFELMNVIQ